MTNNETINTDIKIVAVLNFIQTCRERGKKLIIFVSTKFCTQVAVRRSTQVN